MTDKLLPCPFCGGEARICAKNFTNGEAYAWVECGCCHAKSRYSDSIEDLTFAWNARAERTCVRFWTGAEMICSECAHQLNSPAAIYCPNCGAKVVD